MASKYYLDASKQFKLAVDKWDEKKEDQKIRIARATLNIGVCENEAFLRNKNLSDLNPKLIISTLSKGLEQIKDPSLESFITKKTKELIEIAENALSFLQKT